MTYKEWSDLKSKRAIAMTRQRQLRMTIQMNKAYKGYWRKHKSGRTREEVIQKAEEELAKIVVPDVPEQPFGYEVTDKNGVFLGFFCSEDLDRISKECEMQQKNGEIPEGALFFERKPRFDDRDDFRYV